MIKVLIVEDDPMVAEFNRRYLARAEGFELVAVASSGDEALSVLAREAVDLDAPVRHLHGVPHHGPDPHHFRDEAGEGVEGGAGFAAGQGLRIELAAALLDQREAIAVEDDVGGADIPEIAPLTDAHEPGRSKAGAARAPQPDIASLENELSEVLGAKVAIAHGRGGKGRLVIHYSDLDTLDGVLERLRGRQD